MGARERRSVGAQVLSAVSSYDPSLLRSYAPALLDPRPGVLQRHGAVEDEVSCRAVGIHDKISHSLELKARTCDRARKARLHFGVANDFEGVRVQALEVIVFGSGIFHGEQAIVQSHLGAE